MPTKSQKEDEAARLYRQRLALPKPRPEFLTWAQSNRQNTAA